MTRAPELHIAVCQLTSSDRFEQNALEIEKRLDSLSDPSSLDVVFFPENALYMRLRDDAKPMGLHLDDEALMRLVRWSVRHQVPLHIGSVPLLEKDKITNASLLLTPDGQVRPIYRKIHLFDVDVVGQKPVRESDVFTRGEEPSIFEIKGWKFGSSICYDVRFSELYLRYAKAGVDVIVIPAAFLTTTGKAHWEVLLRARAIESQAFVVAAAQGGVHHGVDGGQRETHGHSMVVDPWGVVLAEAPQEASRAEQILRVTLKSERVEAVRRQIPMKNHRTLV
ncbi:MAG: carbon-nitrogen hydrolase family protein [Bdellovibrionaceae bacterium]|nr:carbon-nitrogen hydrolase family protein [Pseudobdellovibrionaceae bacterium]